jgi:predicted nucleotidyltransferase
MRNRGSWRDLNPRATRGEYAEVFRLARRVAVVETARDADAVVLAGSWARGDAHRNSDVDLWVIGRSRGYDFRVLEGRIVSISRKTAADLRAELRSPRLVGVVVPAWRTGRILVDRRGVARRLRREAARFTWERVGPRCDRYVAASLAEWAEEAVKVTHLMPEGHRESAAVQRNLLVNAMAALIAVDLRLFYHENDLWERVGDRMGRSWHRLQRRALGVAGESLEDSCRAALDLYCETVRALAPRLSREQRRVVRAACASVGNRSDLTSIASGSPRAGTRASPRSTARGSGPRARPR